MMNVLSRSSHIILALALAGSASAQSPSYQQIDLGGYPGAHSTAASGVNDHGTVVGDAWLVGTGSIPVYGSPSVPWRALPLLPGDTVGLALDINNSDVIAGVSGDLFTGRGVIWTPTANGYVVSALPPTSSGVQPGLGFAINDLGDVVGRLANGFGFAWSSGTGTIDLSASAFTSVPVGINESRQAVGGHERIDLDTHFVEIFNGPQFVLDWSLTDINDSGVCIAHANTQNPFGHSLSIGLRYEPGGVWQGFGVGGQGAANGIDYASNVVYSGSLVNGYEAIHFDDFGDFALTSVLQSPLANGTIDPIAGIPMSANGLIAFTSYDMGLSRISLLVPKAFSAILGGVPGIAGPPVLSGYGSAASGTPFRLVLSRTAPNAPFAIIAGVSAANLPFFGGTLVPSPNAVLTGLTTNSNGRYDFTSTWPSGIPSGTTLFVQDWIIDAAAPLGVAGSNTLSCVTP